MIIRRLTWLSLITTVVAYGLLYHLSYAVGELEKQQHRIDRSIAGEKENIHVLEAEWAYLNRPDYLQRMNQHLQLGAVAVKQMIPLSKIPAALSPEEAEKVAQAVALAASKKQMAAAKAATPAAKPGTRPAPSPTTTARAATPPVRSAPPSPSVSVPAAKPQFRFNLSPTPSATPVRYLPPVAPGVVP